MQNRDARSQVLITPSFDEEVVVRSGWGFRKSNHLYQMHHITPTLNKISCQHVASLALGGMQYCCIQNASHQPSHYQLVHIKASEYLATVVFCTQFRSSWPRYCRKDLQTEILHRMLQYIVYTFKNNLGAKIGPRSPSSPTLNPPIVL